jgi:hypothetical protein
VSFQRRAWYAAADEYGRRRAERYGAYARAGRGVCWLAGVLLLVGIVVAAHGGFGG